MDNTAGPKQTRAHLECTDNNLLAQVTKEPTRKGVLLDLILANKEELVRDVKVRVNLHCSSHEVVEFRILR